jgi:uncharacterized membrane protein
VAGGALQERFGFLPGFLLTAVLYLLSSALWLLLFYRQNTVKPRERPDLGILEGQQTAGRAG